MSNSVFATRQEEERKVGLQNPHRELYTKSHLQRRIPVLLMSMDVNEVNDCARTGRITAVFFEFALFEKLGG